jgi:hypothetical protein
MGLYRNDPLAGIDFTHLLSGTVALMGDEETFRAVPYYFGAIPPVSWKLNGGANGSDQDLTVRATGATGGSALIQAAATDTEGTAQSGFTLTFGAGSSSGL